ncbi:winged helix-turn-helix transcriptional regulator, partial [Streptomyces sp. NPDC058257]|uniref:winged helix-turn-helix transcriptional regulator n=1 Tax=Streptomyces sp. NPDC058257 TaxID=3346409 RepID=UPI0036EC6E6A
GAPVGSPPNWGAARLHPGPAGGGGGRGGYPPRPARHEYVLTPAGQELYGTVLTLMTWGDRHRSDGEGPPLLPVHDTCGHPAEPRVTCAHCGGELTAGTVTHTPGPGGRTAPGTALVHTVLPAG